MQNIYEKLNVGETFIDYFLGGLRERFKLPKSGNGILVVIKTNNSYAISLFFYRNIAVDNSYMKQWWRDTSTNSILESDWVKIN